MFSEWKEEHVGMEPQKPTKLDENDTTTLLQQPYTLCNFAAT